MTPKDEMRPEDVCRIIDEINNAPALTPFFAWIPAEVLAAYITSTFGAPDSEVEG